MFIHDKADPTFFGHSGFMISPGMTYSLALQKVYRHILYRDISMFISFYIVHVVLNHIEGNGDETRHT